MKKLTTEIENKGVKTAAVHDYQSGTFIGRVVADWGQYRLWAEGPSDVCAAGKCVSRDALNELGIGADSVIFLLA